MPKTDTFQDLALTAPKDGQMLWTWIYDQLRAAILDGRLKSGSRLPSTRNLASQYNLARGTVVTAFRQLHTEGYVRTEKGAGTRVATALPDRSLKASPARPRAVSKPSRATLARQAQKALSGASILPAPRSIGRAFRSFEPAIDLFPVELWVRVASRVLRHAPRSLYGHGSPAGYMPLRKAIAEYIGASRAVRCSPHQVIVTAGAQQALDLTARMLLDPGDQVWMEDPGYPGALQAFRSAGAQPVPVPVDADGMMVAEARKLAPRARLAYVTPANQFPLGTTLSAARRLELLRWAFDAGAWIVEDDYDAEYRYHGRPIASLQSLDHSGSVVYIGTFTKMLFNALRIGFVVVPDRLVEAFELGKCYIDRHAPTLDQAILAEFISEGHFGHHVRRMRHTYSERLGVLKDAAQQRLHGLVDVADATSGMRTLGWLRNGLSDAEAARRVHRLEVETSPLSVFSQRHQHPPALILGFAGCHPAEIRRGVDVVAAALA